NATTPRTGASRVKTSHFMISPFRRSEVLLSNSQAEGEAQCERRSRSYFWLQFAIAAWHQLALTRNGANCRLAPRQPVVGTGPVRVIASARDRSANDEKSSSWSPGLFVTRARTSACQLLLSSVLCGSR